MPRFRTPVSGSLVTTHGNVMKRPASKGQHFWMGRFRSVGNSAPVPSEALMSRTQGQGSFRVKGISNLWITCLQAPLLTPFGLACRNDTALLSSSSAWRRLVGGLALMSEPSSVAICSTDSAPILMAIRLCEPKALMASGNGETWPLTVGLLEEKPFPAPGLLHLRIGDGSNHRLGCGGQANPLQFACGI